MKKISEAASLLGRKGGKSKSEAKVAAARRNAKKICDCCHKKSEKLEQWDEWFLCAKCRLAANEDEWAMQPK